MSLLELAHATKRFASGQREVVALDDVSLVLDPGECVAVCGPRRSGRTTLLRVAAGMVPLDAGCARFDDRDLAHRRRPVLGAGIAYCNPLFDPSHGGAVAEHVAIALLARRVGRTRARELAEAALERAGAGACAALEPRELHVEELVRAGIARALVTQPRLLLLDEPTNGVDLLERDRILALLRALAEDGLAVLATVGEPVPGTDRMLALDRGRLRAHAPLDPAPVVPLHPRRVEPVA